MTHAFYLPIKIIFIFNVIWRRRNCSNRANDPSSNIIFNTKIKNTRKITENFFDQYDEI